MYFFLVLPEKNTMSRDLWQCNFLGQTRKMTLAQKLRRCTFFGFTRKNTMAQNLWQCTFSGLTRKNTMAQNLWQCNFWVSPEKIQWHKICQTRHTNRWEDYPIHTRTNKCLIRSTLNYSSGGSAKLRTTDYSQMYECYLTPCLDCVTEGRSPSLLGYVGTLRCWAFGCQLTVRIAIV